MASEIVKVAKNQRDVNGLMLSQMNLLQTNLLSLDPSTGGNGVVYINGNATTDGSLRLVSDVDENTVTVEERVSGAWFDGTLRGRVLFAGRNAAITAAGDKLVVTSDVTGDKYLVVQSKFDDNGSLPPEAPVMPAKDIRSISQSDDTGEIIGTSVSWTITPTSNQVIDKIYLKTGSTPATKDLVWTAYPTAYPTALYVKRVIPKADWIANTELSFSFEAFGLTSGVSFTGHLESAASFSIKTDVTNTLVWRASDRWILNTERIAYAPAWSAKTWNKDDQVVESGLIYVCNQTGAQTGTFAANSAKWVLLADLIATIKDYKGGISVVNFNALTSAAKGDQYDLSTAGTLVGGQVASVLDVVTINNTFTGRTIIASDYSYFSAPSALPIGTILEFAGSTAPTGFLLTDQDVSRATYANLFGVLGTTFGSGDGVNTFGLPRKKGRVSVGVGQGVFTSTFANTSINVSTNEITVPSNNSIYTGTPVVLSTTGTAPAGLTTGNTYYAIIVSSTLIKLATTRANAVVGTAIDITGQGTSTHTLTITYTNRTLGSVGGEEYHTLNVSEIPSHDHDINDTYSIQYASDAFNTNVSATDEISRTETTTATGGSGSHNIMNPHIVMNFIIKF
jgi:microcystin-dependent protein